MGAREDIAAAASTVADIDVSPRYRQNAKPGMGWVSLTRVNRDENGDFMDTWAISIPAGQSLAAAEAFVEKYLDDLLAALEPVLIVTAAFPAELRLDQGTTNGLAIEGSLAH